METNSGHDTPTPTFTIALPKFLVHWYQKLPSSTWRAALLLFAFGVGIGGGIFATKETILWYQNLPLPSLPDKTWPEFNFPDYGLKAQLSSEWDESSHELNYKLALMPSDKTNPEEFFSRYYQHGTYAHVTLNLFDKRHFNVANSEDYLNLFTAVVDADGKKHLVVYQGKLFITRSQYAALSGWDLTVSGFPPLNRNSANIKTPQKQNTSEKSTDTSGLHGDDIITGYSVVESNLATSSGLTFHIYKDAETDKAIEWGVDNARVHYECNPALECTLHRRGTGVILHAMLRK